MPSGDSAGELDCPSRVSRVNALGGVTLLPGDRNRLVDLCASHLQPSRDTYLMNLKRLGQLKEEAA